MYLRGVGLTCLVSVPIDRLRILLSYPWCPQSLAQGGVIKVMCDGKVVEEPEASVVSDDPLLSEPGKGGEHPRPAREF